MTTKKIVSGQRVNESASSAEQPVELLLLRPSGNMSEVYEYDRMTPEMRSRIYPSDHLRILIIAEVDGTDVYDETRALELLDVIPAHVDNNIELGKKTCVSIVVRFLTPAIDARMKAIMQRFTEGVGYDRLELRKTPKPH